MILKDKMDMYMHKDLEIVQTKMHQLKYTLAQTLNSYFETNLSRKLVFNTAIADYLIKSDSFIQMFASLNTSVLIGLSILATIVIYSLMMADVDDQTYQFAMMRAVGFKQAQVLLFVTV